MRRTGLQTRDEIKIYFFYKDRNPPRRVDSRASSGTRLYHRMHAYARGFNDYVVIKFTTA